MRSDTFLSLAEFAEWVGFDPWRFAGINRDYTPPGPSGKGEGNQTCKCVAHYPWQSGRQSRQDFIKALRRAERIFVMWTGVYPSPRCVVAEQQDYPYPEAGLINAKGELKSISLNWRPIQKFGLCSLTLWSSAVELTRDDSGSILDIFTATFAVPDNTTADQVRVYFSPADDTSESPSLPIRPLRVKIDSSGGTGNWEATISGPAYLFVRPTLYESRTFSCLTHELATYVEAVDIYLETVDECSAGQFVGSSWPCNALPCTEKQSPACVTLRSGRAVFRPAKCDDGNIYRDYCLELRPEKVMVNYIAGKPLVNGYMDAHFADILSMMTIAMLECDYEICECESCANKKFGFYREVPKEKTGEGGPGMEGNLYRVTVPAEIIEGLHGLDPRRGLVMASAMLEEYAMEMGTA